MPAEGRENPLLKKGNSDAFFREKYLTKNKYPLYLRGIQALDSHVMDRRYSGEIAAHQACKTMYLAACLLTGQTFHKIERPENYIAESIGKSKYKKFSYIKKQKLESYGYLVEAVRLLEE